MQAAANRVGYLEKPGIFGSRNKMSNRFILVDLDKEQKSIILDKASFYIFDDETTEDLNNNRKKWIRFKGTALSEIIGELSYYYNRSNNNYESMVLDELISHLEHYKRQG